MNMEELSTQDKAKRYDEALDRAKKVLLDCTPEEQKVVEYISPELKESEEEKPNGGIVLEDFNEGDGFYKVNLAYLSKEQVEEIENMVKEWNRHPSESDDEKIRKAIIEHFVGSHSCMFPYKGFTQEQIIAWLEKQVPVHLSHDDEIMIRQLTEYFTTGKGLQNTNDTVVEWLEDIKRKLEKQPEQTPIKRKDFIFIPFGAFDSELIEETITIPDGCVATIEGNRIHIKRKSKSATEAIKEEKVNNANKVEPKFKVGDWIVNNITKDVFLIKSFNSGYYTLEDVKGNIISPCLPPCESESHLWSIEDAKDGDVLAVENRPFIYNGKVNPLSVGGYCGITTNSLLKIYEERPGYGTKGWTMFDGDIHPATKSQRDLLFQKMKEAGYKWNPETKELNRLDEDEGKNK